MGDFKFACGNCGQHIAVDAAWCGQQLTCPACQTELVVPNAMPTAPPSLPPGAGSTPPPIPLRSGAATPAPVQRQAKRPLCILAPVSLLLVVAMPLVAFGQSMLMPKVPLAPVCLIAGLVCGHLALRRIRLRAQAGKVWAVISLVLGYLCVLGIALFIGFIVAANHGWIKPLQSQRQWTGFPQRSSPQPSQRQFPSGQPSRTMPGPGGFPRSGAPAPNPDAKNNVTGTLAGQPFQCDRARLMGNMLELGQGTDFVSDTSVTIILLGIGDPAGKVVVAPAAPGSIPPQVGVKWRENGRPRMQFNVRDYTMRIEFGKRSGNRVPGRIELEITGNPQTKISGEFTAEPR